jgi:hypothetical protein
LIGTPAKTWTPALQLKYEAEDESSDRGTLTEVEDLTFSEKPADAATISRCGSPNSNQSCSQLNDSDVEPVTPKKNATYDRTEGGLGTPCSSERNLAMAIKSCKNVSTTKRKRAIAPTKSPFFSPPASAEKEKKPRLKGGTISCIPFPPLSSPAFGLLQEKLAHDPFRLLVGVTFLNRTKGKDAIPVFFSLMENYPSPEAILAAPKGDIIALTYHLGFQSQRAETYRKFAHHFIHNPPVKGKRYRVDHYPNPKSGMDIRSSEVLDDDDPRDAWEIGHMTKGRYAIDSWRIFCRDVIRGVATGWNGEGNEDQQGFQPEWMRVQPRDKELIAFLRWMWLREGFTWDPVTGEKEVAGTEIMRAVGEGRMIWDEGGGMRILDVDVEVFDDGNAVENVKHLPTKVDA